MKLRGLSNERLDELIEQLDRVAYGAIVTTMNTVAERFHADVLIAAGAEEITTPSVDVLEPTTVSVDALGQVYTEWQLQVATEIIPVITEVIDESCTHIMMRYANDIGVAVTDIPKVSSVFVEDYIAAASNRLKNIGNELWETARSELGEGMRDGESIEQLSERVRDTAGVSRYRATTIARTEVISASNGGSFEQIKTFGLTGTKEWLATEDGRTRESHRKADGQSVPMDQPFIVGGYALMYPGDHNAPASEVVNCRCTPLYDVDAEGETSMPESVTAAGVADVHDISMTGMVALVPSIEDIERIVIPSGEVPEQLHLTLFFLGDVSSVTQSIQLQLVDRVRELAISHTTIPATGFGVGYWNPDSDTPCAIMNVGGSGLEQVRHAIGEILHEDAWGLRVPEQHCPWVPHIAMSYTDDIGFLNDVVSKLGPISFSTIRISFGEVTYDVPLYDSYIVASAVEGSTTMPYHVGTSAECGASKPHAVIKDDDGKVMGCHGSLKEANDQLAAIHASEGAAGETQELIAKKPHERACNLVLAVEDLETGDGRVFSANALSWAAPPLPLLWQEKTAEGHTGSVVVGRIDTVYRDAANPLAILGTGIVDTSIPAGAQVAALVDSKSLRGISVDVDSIKENDIEFVFPSTDTVDENGDEMPDELKSLFGMAPEVIIFHTGRIRGATLVALPAFVEAQITFADTPIPVPTDSPTASGSDKSEDEMSSIVRVNDSLVAAGVMLSDRRIEMYSDPKFNCATPLSVTEDGRIYGHAALFGTCHIGVTDKCMRPPFEASHDFYALGEVVTNDGASVAVGGITMGTGHAPTFGITAQQAMEHYDNTGTRVADVAIGNDEFGIWVAGTVRPGVSEECIANLRAASLSGDWRRIGGSLRLVALLAVNVPGFPVPRLSTAVSRDKQMSLVASGVVTDTSVFSPGPSAVRLRLRRQMFATHRATLRNRMK